VVVVMLLAGGVKCRAVDRLFLPLLQSSVMEFFCRCERTRLCRDVLKEARESDFQGCF
jgi:hypothetical protein